MPVAMISTSTSPCLRPFEVDLDDLERLLGREGDGGAGLHESVLLLFAPPMPQEAPYPTRNALIVVRRVERGDRGVRVGHHVVALLDQRLGEFRREFRMELE